MNIKPKLRQEGLIELYSAIVNGTFPFQSCINCKNFNEPDELCILYKMKPPVRVLVFGCDSYEDVGDIPF